MKYTKAEARYDNTTPDNLGRICVMCRSYDAGPRSCSLIEGTVHPWGRCTWWAAMREDDYGRLLGQQPGDEIRKPNRGET